MAEKTIGLIAIETTRQDIREAVRAEFNDDCLKKEWTLNKNNNGI